MKTLLIGAILLLGLFALMIYLEKNKDRLGLPWPKNLNSPQSGRTFMFANFFGLIVATIVLIAAMIAVGMLMSFEPADTAVILVPKASPPVP